MTGPCEAPPPGWACSRGAGHSGPCAATPRHHALPAAPGYSQALEFTVALLLRGMDPPHKLMLARRMQEVFAHLEQEALTQLEAAEGNGG